MQVRPVCSEVFHANEQTRRSK